jgi:hypothetical protein
MPMEGYLMYKVTVIPVCVDLGDPVTIHDFMSEPEARAYILGVREWTGSEVREIRLNGHRVIYADPKQRGG